MDLILRLGGMHKVYAQTLHGAFEQGWKAFVWFGRGDGFEPVEQLLRLAHVAFDP